MSYTDAQGKERCNHCNKPVVAGQPVYGITGDHWDCQQTYKKRALEDVADDLIKRADTLEKAHAIIRSMVCNPK